MDTNKPAIIVALREYYPLLYAWKEKCHPSWNVKFLTPEEVLDRLSISFAKDPLPFLLSHGMEYNKAKKYEKILKYSLDIHYCDEYTSFQCIFIGFCMFRGRV